MITDTSPDVKQKQLEIWLSKPPMEQLRIALEDNDAQFALFNELKKNNSENKPGKPAAGLAAD
jgi:hypothetical protein